MNPFIDQTPEELEFATEDGSITIIPNFMLPSLELISGTLGSFKPNNPVQVPIWVAINLKRSKKCKMQVPRFLTEEELKERIAEEKKQKGLTSIDFKLFDVFKIFEK